ncbi:protein-L-isoaspartate(D-aspartate) O-methyltransferase [bacterium]|nr:protein-L-isoaspartate(D-aspartate) O-methyltransferase [bacterium]
MTRERKSMVERTIVARGISDRAVISAMLKVPRHKFVPKALRKEAYEDCPLPIGYNQTISQPYIVALMVELAHIDRNSKVLEIGTGSAYQAAVLAEIADQVYTIEIVKELMLLSVEKISALDYENVHLRLGDGASGWLEEAPFSAIIVSAAPKKIPEAMIEQLAVYGKLVVPVGKHDQILKVITRTEHGIEVDDSIPVRFVPMTGEIFDE